jgi:hypothetical protein
MERKLGIRLVYLKFDDLNFIIHSFFPLLYYFVRTAKIRFVLRGGLDKVPHSLVCHSEA